jgi:glutamate-ammonia-ligase adenylyltransferase
VAHQHLLPDQGEMLQKHYLYLRDLEHKLQMVHELQTHTLPVQETEILKCAIRMGYEVQQLNNNPAPFLTEYRMITSQVRDLFQHILS